MNEGWPQLLDGFPWFRGAGRYPVRAYSEFMPPPRLGRKPSGDVHDTVYRSGDESGWQMSDREESHELQPGLRHIAEHLLRTIKHVGEGGTAPGISRGKLQGNAYWSEDLRAPKGERYVLLAALALSRTQDDKGRVRWTLFGGSERGPAAFASTENETRMIIECVAKAAFGETDGLRHGVPRSLRGVRYVATFEPFTKLPVQLRNAYLAGDVHLLPFPGSLLFWGVPGYASLQRQLPLARQIPLLLCIDRRESPGGIRVPQSGWFHEKTASAPDAHPYRGPYRETFRRTHRWSRVHRDEDELDLIAPSEDPLVHVLFSTNPDDLGLYGKPMARNVQLWTAEHELLLDGPRASGDAIRAAAERVRAGGTFGYRFMYPPMQVGWHQVFLHRAVAGFLDDAGEPQVIGDVPCGEVIAYDLRTRDFDKPVTLVPRVGVRSGGDTAIASLSPTDPLTFDRTTSRDFEVAYWNTIQWLAMGEYVNKDNADEVLDEKTQRKLHRHGRDLDPLANALIRHHRDAGAEADALRFRWETDFPYDWSEGWRRNQQAGGSECNVIARIPGRNHRRAVIMADHFDTAYMEDVFGYPKRTGPRLAAHGADDNCSATATLLLATPVFLHLSRAGQLACDIWLVHLTGEEFPSDCLGARALVQRIIEGTLAVDVAGVFVLDMIAHNNDRHPNVFQISPGAGDRALHLATHALAATSDWNHLPQGERRGRAKRTKKGALPNIAAYPRLRGDLRRHDHPRSTVYNTDAQIFSDAGFPVVLFMEDYDIDRKGYHDSHDTMDNIDLDYGAAVAAIAIETVARVAVADRP